MNFSPQPGSKGRITITNGASGRVRRFNQIRNEAEIRARDEKLIARFSDVPWDRLNLNPDGQPSPRELEAHIARLHLVGQILFILGVPAYDILRLRYIGGRKNLLGFGSMISGIIEAEKANDQFSREYMVELARVLKFICEVGGTEFSISRLPNFSRLRVREGALDLIDTERMEIRNFAKDHY
jgi:hypothetical protein